jgi:hypothetical protein
MNQNFDLTVQLDRLADGELPAEDYRALLAALDEEPQGWRRCAMALLEAQALRKDLELLRGECLASPAKVVALPSMKTQRARRPWLTILAMAASFLIALPVGPYLVHWFVAPAKPLIVEQPKSKPRVAPAITNTGGSQTPAPLGNLVLTSANGQVEVPYYDVNQGAKYLLDDRALLPPATIQSLERSGHRVERTPSVMPVDLENGSRVYLPVDNYRITPVRERPAL